jgi:O-antigen/teichoic acid export membrane protein
VRFGGPLALASIGAFYTTYGDRFFIKQYWGLAEVGLYALSYRFGFALSYLVYGTFNQVWSAQSYLAFRETDGKDTFRRVFLLIMLALIGAATALSVLAKDVLRIMAAPSFLPAAAAIPAILAAYVIRAAGDFCGFGIRLQESTRHFLHASILSVVVMSIGYLTLIPRWGGVGAAIATLAGMTIEAWWICRVSERLVPLHYPWPRVGAAALMGVATYVLADILAPSDLWGSIAVRLSLLAAFAAGIYFSPIVGVREREACMRLASDTLRKVRSVTSTS